MELKYEQKNNTLTVVLPSEIDHHSAKPVREEVDIWILKLMPRVLILDFSEVKFMDSSGVGLILGRYNKVTVYGGKLIVECADKRTMQLLRLAGVQKLVEIKDAVRA